jgi:alkylation response protein AidB-like acyl-CoA dehydrogenase
MSRFAPLSRSLRANRFVADRARVTEALAALHHAHVLNSDFIREATANTARFPLFELLVELGRSDLSIARLYEGHVNAFQLVARLGDKSQLERAKAIADKGGLLGIWGADNQHAPGRITVSDESYQLSGMKTFASGVEVVSLPLIAVKTSQRQTQLVMMDRHSLADRIDLSTWSPIGMTATGSFSVGLDGIAGGLDDLLGSAGVYETQPFFGAGAIRFVSAQLGGLIGVYDATVTHLQMTGRYDNAHQAARLGQMLAETEAVYCYVRDSYGRVASAISWELEPSQSDCSRIADAARVAVEAAAERVMSLAVRSVGCNGLIDTHPLAKAMTDLTVYLRQPAPDAALVRVGEGVGAGTYRAIFNE